mgnify:CR=1 FL=1
MSFDYSTLITDRARSDSDTVKALLGKPMAEWTEAERTAFNTAVLKGSYDYTDLNRVGACLEDLVARLGRVGCIVPGYERLKIERTVTPSSRLPDGYTEVQYIQSTGTQWVDTGFTPDQDTRIIYDCERLSTVSAEHFFGVRTGTSAKEAFCFYIYNSGWRYAYNNYVSTGKGRPSTGRYLFDANRNVMKINSDLILKGTYAKFKASATATLFSMRSVNSGISYGSHKLFNCKIYNNDSLARDFIPCTNANGAAGLYDLIGQKFYGNAGTGSFTAGPVVTGDASPEEPTETLDPYTWYESDVPVSSQMARYRANVAAVRAVLRLPEETPEVPETMRQLTTAEANSIEAILLALNFILNQIPTAVRHCGVTVCGSKGVRA